MSDEEEDYMSDKFLASLADVRPSLISDRAKKRQVVVSNKQNELIKRQRNERLERTGANRNEQLQESLQRPIAQENKGFQLLAKMGYKPGDVLGKNVACGGAGGIKEPIGISIKSDRSGFGRELAISELAKKQKDLRDLYMQRKSKTETITAEEYRRRAMAKAEERFLFVMLRKCQSTCQNLDITIANVEEPNIEWFWPSRNKCETGESKNEEKPDGDDSVETEVDYSISEQMEMLTGYMRTAYNYCVWCGVHYKNVDDLETNCAGPLREDH